MNPDECEFLHEDHCIVEVEYPDFVCDFRFKENPDDILWRCNASSDDLLTEEEYQESMKSDSFRSTEETKK